MRELYRKLQSVQIPIKHSCLCCDEGCTGGGQVMSRPKL